MFGLLQFCSCNSLLLEKVIGSFKLTKNGLFILVFHIYTIGHLNDRQVCCLIRHKRGQLCLGQA